MSFLKKIFGKKEEVQEVQERTVLNIEVGDIISYDLEDYQVVGTLTYSDHGFQWLAYQLQSTGKTIWLSVEMDDELNIGVYEKVKLKLKEPLPDELVFEGNTYYLDESGVAQVTGKGRGKNVNNIECKYYDYCDDAEEHFLSVEVWGSEVEVSYGYEIDEFEIKIIASN